MRILFLCHAHPELQAGGTEIFARALFRDLRRRPGIDGVFLAGTACGQRPPSPGTPFQVPDRSAGVTGGVPADELLVWTGGFDPFFQSQTDLYGVVPSLAALLAELRPEIVHIHHLLTLGIEIVGLIRRIVPKARIVMTLHDYYAICANDGQMVTTAGSLCHAASADACHRCFPDRARADFRLRDLQIGGALRQIDRFVAPSRFLRDRFLAGPFAEWEIAANRVALLGNGIAELPVAPPRASPDGRRDRFGFFGHINRFKGASVALDASARLSCAGKSHALTLHGGTAHQAQAVLDTFAQALAGAPDARHAGPYTQADLPRLMAGVDWVIVPSLWWENAPLVIQEAFRYGRPVICADIGGMAEMVRDGIDGLHAAVGDAASFAQAMRRALDEPGLWDRLAGGITPPVTVSEAASAHLALYENLLDRPARRRTASGAAASRATSRAAGRRAA